MDDERIRPVGPARRRARFFNVLVTAGGCLLIPILLLSVLVLTPQEILWADHPSWQEFRSWTSDQLAIPAEAQPVSWRRAGFFLSAYAKATFRLPATRSPQAWLKHMVNRTWLKGASSPDGLEYRARQGYYIRYLPAKGLYEAQWDTEWDGDDG